jgi:GT2 family glycosyltransferase
VLPAADLAVVVLSYRNEGTILGAVDSLLEQGESLEIVVVHSGGGPTRALLREQRPTVRVLESENRLFPGAARNTGIAATSAPFVAFLAGDCIAMPGWAQARIARHRAGAGAVSSALLPASRSASSVAASLLLCSDRLPHLRSPSPSTLSGVSYDRRLLEAFGPFPDGVAFGEDPAFNDRLLAAGVHIDWAPETVAAHHFPSGLGALLIDHYKRGRRRGSLYRDPLRRGLFACGAVVAPARGLWRSARAGAPFRPSELIRAAPLLLAGTAATVAGVLRAGNEIASGPELASLRRRAWFRVGPGDEGPRLAPEWRGGLSSGEIIGDAALDESG